MAASRDRSSVRMPSSGSKFTASARGPVSHLGVFPRSLRSLRLMGEERRRLATYE